MMKQTFKGLVAMLMAGTMLFSCSKDDGETISGSGKAKVSMRLTDAAAEYDAVYLDIQKVEVTMEGSSAVELTPTRPGIYDILKFRNGLDTLLLDTELQAGKIGQIRLILGNNNSVVVDSKSYALTTPSGQQSGIKLNLNQTLEADGAYTIWIDFDAAKSIHQTGKGKYMLKPVIRAYSALTNGRIEGTVLPLASLTTVYAINGADTFSAIPNANAYFMFTGLPEGKYQLYFDAEALGYQDKTMTDVDVSFGKINNIGTITIGL